MPQKVLIAGVGPIPPHRPDRLYATGLRLWGFATEVARAGFEVVLGEAMFSGEDGAGAAPPPLPDGMQWRPLSLAPEQAAQEISRIVRDEGVACAVASTDVMAAALVRARPAAPVWVDFNGHPMTERQMLAHVHSSDGGLLDQWAMILPALLGADRFSVACDAQKHALLGELGACGRLNRWTVGGGLVSTIHPALAVTEFPARQGAIRETIAPENAFVVLHSGGYNTWMDEETLFRGLERAMEREPRLRFVSLGGAIRGHNEATFERFRARVERSPHRERFHFPGWVASEEVGSFYAEADAAINLDLDCYEGVFGWRNRVLEWAAAGVPVLTTPLSEISRDLIGRGMAREVGFGDAEGLADRLVEMAANPEPSREAARLAREYVREHYNYTRALAPLLAWLENPEPAPDLPPPAERGTGRWPPAPENPLAGLWREVLEERLDSASAPASGTKSNSTMGSRLRRIFPASK